MSYTKRESLRLVGVAGSGRSGSLNKVLVQAAAGMSPPGTSIDVFEGFADIPVFNEDLEQEVPEAVAELRTMISGAHGLLVSTPEYNQSIPGGVKNLVDWLSRSEGGVAGLPVAVTGVTTGRWGTRIAQTLLRQMLLSTGALVLPQPQLFVANGADVFDSAGAIVDPDLHDRLEKLIVAFSNWIRLVGAGVYRQA